MDHIDLNINIIYILKLMIDWVDCSNSDIFLCKSVQWNASSRMVKIKVGTLSECLDSLGLYGRKLWAIQVVRDISCMHWGR